jgi:ABC-type branched-subunit amino acid transport system ATPase component
VSDLLSTRGLSAGYGSLPVVHDLDLEVRPGEIVSLLGPNGAGKSTTMLTLSGFLPALGGEVFWSGQPARKPLHLRARDGLAFVTEERSVFKRLSTRDNLRVANVDVDFVLELFPELEPRLKLPAGLMSGGEQQMLSLARALGRKPRLLLADELSLGLAPLIVDRLLAAVRSAADKGVGVLLVEQHVRRVLDVADRAYVMRRGRIEIEGTAGEIRTQMAKIERSYLGGREQSGAEL